MNKLKELPLGVILAVAAVALALAGYMVFRSIKGEDTAYTTPMDRGRYMEEMKKKAGSGVYSPKGSPGSRGTSSGQGQSPNNRYGGGYGGMRPGGSGGPGGQGGYGGYGGGGQGGYGGGPGGQGR